MKQTCVIQASPCAGASAEELGSVVVKRTIAATVVELFDAFLEPTSLAQWMHPGTSALSTASVDARVGGAFEVVMHHPRGDLRHYGIYREIKRNEKLVFTWYSDATLHRETLVTVVLNVVSAGTEIVVTHEHIPHQEAARSRIEGWSEALCMLAALLGELVPSTIQKETT